MKTLVCPLNWGLGHATRCVPLIRKEIADGNEVVIAADGYPLLFLKKQFPDLQFVSSESYPIRYSKGDSMVWQIVRVFPFLISRSRKEHLWLRDFCRKEKIARVISDNRFGLWNKEVHSIYMTHQVMIKMPQRYKMFEKIIYKIHKKIIEKYDECWIPDIAERGGYSGDLSHQFPLPSNAKFIGVLSRFDVLCKLPQDDTFDNVVILSGVEPQRSIFEEAMVKKYRDLPQKTVMIVGKPSEHITQQQIGNITQYSHLSDEALIPYLKGCQTIVCRAGYSTVMDLVVLGVEHKAIYYPTPGQTEQVYLAEYLHERREVGEKR